MSEQTEISFNLKKVYVKDISFESPLSPQIFLIEQAPEVDVQMNITHSALEESNLFEVVQANILFPSMQPRNAE